VVRVRLASGPTGPLHRGNALAAVADRTFADDHGALRAILAALPREATLRRIDAAL
jgi:hypothetical protein